MVQDVDLSVSLNAKQRLWDTQFIQSLDNWTIIPTLTFTSSLVIIQARLTTPRGTVMWKHATYDLKLRGGIRPLKEPKFWHWERDTYDPASQASGAKIDFQNQLEIRPNQKRSLKFPGFASRNNANPLPIRIEAQDQHRTHPVSRLLSFTYSWLHFDLLCPTDKNTVGNANRAN